MNLVAFGSGIGVMVALWLVYVVLAHTWNPWKLIEGADGAPSTSKLQWFLWTIIALFSYTVIYAARISLGITSPITDIPSSLLIAMGFSVTTMAAAKGITASYVTSGQIVKAPAKRPPRGPGAIFTDDDGDPDLSKVQMMAWTFIGIGVYLIRVAQQVSSPDVPELPDIDVALMVLMGLGQGAYLGKKLTTTTTARLTGLTPAGGPAGTNITISGISFGDTQDGSFITIDGTPNHTGPVRAWHDNQIEFTLPAMHPDGSPWTPGQHLIGAIIGGKESANQLPLTVA